MAVINKIKLPGYDTPFDLPGGSGASTLAGLTDTSITTPADGQGLVYDSTTSKWKNAYLSGAKYDSSNTLADIIGDVESLLAAL